MNLVPRLPGHAEETMHAFLEAHALEPPSTGLVIGLSGGIDSALAARLAVDAIGPERVVGLLLPDEAFPVALLEETTEFGRSLGIATRVIPIDAIVSALTQGVPEITDRASVGNAKARARMMILYSVAREERKLVLGTGNKSELLLGYFTKYGDGGVDLLPLGDLYKTQVRELAQKLSLPAAIRERAPTAGLWPGQTDEGELGITYEKLDRILFAFEQLLTPREVADHTGIPLEEVERVERRMLANRHKRRMPPIPKLALRTVGLDWKE